jgi:hypothetical protein
MANFSLMKRLLLLCRFSLHFSFDGERVFGDGQMQLLFTHPWRHNAYHQGLWCFPHIDCWLECASVPLKWGTFEKVFDDSIHLLA